MNILTIEVCMALCVSVIWILMAIPKILRRLFTPDVKKTGARIKVQDNVFGINPFLPISIIEWTPHN